MGVKSKKRALTLAGKTPRWKSLEEYTWGKSYRYILVVPSCLAAPAIVKDRSVRTGLADLHCESSSVLRVFDPGTETAFTPN